MPATEKSIYTSQWLGGNYEMHNAAKRHKMRCKTRSN